jgi:hypothetical protein
MTEEKWRTLLMQVQSHLGIDPGEMPKLEAYIEKFVEEDDNLIQALNDATSCDDLIERLNDLCGQVYAEFEPTDEVERESAVPQPAVSEEQPEWEEQLLKAGGEYGSRMVEICKKQGRGAEAAAATILDALGKGVPVELVWTKLSTPRPAVPGLTRPAPRPAVPSAVASPVGPHTAFRVTPRPEPTYNHAAQVVVDDTPDEESKWESIKVWVGDHMWYLIGGGALLLVIVVIVLLLVVKPFSKGANQAQATPSEAAQAQATEVPTLELTPTEIPTPTRSPTPEPTVALSPQVASLVPMCEGKFNTQQGMIVSDFIGKRGYYTPSETSRHFGASFIDGVVYTLLPVLDTWYLVQTQSGAAYVPTTWFKGVTQPACTQNSLVPGYTQALTRMQLKPGLSVTLFDESWWRPYAIGFIVVLILGVIFELLLKRRFKPILFVGVTIALLLSIMGGVSADKQLNIYLLGLLVMISLGDRGALNEIRATIRTTTQVGQSGQVDSALDVGRRTRGFVMGIIHGVDWSASMWWTAACLIWTLFSREGSPLSILYGPKLAAILYGCQLALFMGLEAIRRGESRDWLVYTIVGVATAITAALFLFVPLTARSWAVAITVVAVVVIVAIIGFTDNDLVQRDRVPEAYVGYSTLVLMVLILIVA